MKKQMMWKTKGMNQDLSVSAFNPEFSFENKNLRLSTNESNTLMSWVNEKGPAELSIYKENKDGVPDGETTLGISGVCIGTAVLNNFLILFTVASDKDRIYRLQYTDHTKTALMGKLLYEGRLGFEAIYPIETLVSYEADNIQKVYWTDGKNQPRIINIMMDEVSYTGTSQDSRFDFVRELKLNEVVTVKKILGANGLFAPGVIQYAFTYYDKYGQETNIFHTTPLYYISYADRGASPEDKVENAFRIKVTGIDSNFDYLRIYSIQRTSINATPICKRIQDIYLTADDGSHLTEASYTDIGTSGDTVDPTELLYKGGESIVVQTLEQKDSTLFMGNIKIDRPYIDALERSAIKAAASISSDTRTILPTAVSTNNYIYYNQLTSTNSTGVTVPCGGFKYGDYYRLGLQFQYKTGRWSNPVWIGDKPQSNVPSGNSNTVTLPIFVGTLTKAKADALKRKGYIKVRPIVVMPGIQDRITICQGVVNPTLYTNRHYSTDEDLHAQSDWFFRPPMKEEESLALESIRPKGWISSADSTLVYTSRMCGNGIPETGTAYNPNKKNTNIKQVEIQGDYDGDNKFMINNEFLTLHSPDIQFNDELATTDFNNFQYKIVGKITVDKTFSDIDIQTESPAISNAGGGFVHKAFVKDGMYGIVSGLFYDDYAVDDSSDQADARFQKYDREHSSYKWMVYLWNKNGSLNNDINRPADRGTATALLKKKVISNLRFATTTLQYSSTKKSFKGIPQLFSSEEASIVKVDNGIYQGNIDTMLMPDHAEGQYFAHNSTDFAAYKINTPFNSAVKWKTFSKQEDSSSANGLWNYNGTIWEHKDGAIADAFVDLVIKKESVRIKYKSSPHLVCRLNYTTDISWDDYKSESLPVFDVVRNLSSSEITDSLFGGQTPDAFRENIWIPCGESVRLDKITNGVVKVSFDYGDTYFQRYDCLKTYPFTHEDPNQVIEIGSFMLETHINIDGRYDRNRGQVSNLNMNPQNFNLLNPIYTQQDNFFTYRIMDDDLFTDNTFSNQVTWSKTKNSGADVDQWTNVTLASVLEMDGDKGKVRKLTRLDNQLLCFQDTSISQILYNENVQISSTDGVPIEIANSEKVQGKRYLSNTIGCSNKWSMVNTPAGIYFMDSNDKSIYRFTGQLENVSVQGGFNSWAKNNIPSQEIEWNPSFPADSNDHSAFVGYYDKLNQDVLWSNQKDTLAFSEKLSAFTSFYDYGNTPFFCNLNDTGIWVRGGESPKLWKHQAGDYCNFFGDKKPYWMTLVGNPEPLLDKIFTNMEFRACVDGEGFVGGTAVDTFDETYDETFHPEDEPVVKDKYVPFLPFDSLETWNEYQHGIAHLSNRNGHDLFKHHTRDNNATLKRKFRIWRCDIPRDNYSGGAGTFDDSFDYTFQGEVRKTRPVDRMRNSWLYLKLMKKVAEDGKNLPRAEIHDLVMTYYI